MKAIHMPNANSNHNNNIMRNGKKPVQSFDMSMLKKEVIVKFFLLLSSYAVIWLEFGVLMYATYLGMIPESVQTMTLKLIFTASLLDAQH